ncbi:anhydro-N-acetylmuramic acid kinase [Janthinobacterium lividum]|uniref:anhydro-N-acetylmuramic acid kinase n=1 Tax=Janthinobacterium lividum TaxID=29581 RepID=UPI0008746C62|nr:anhydro-N-acetylmuramic acid kinase [Janthinobacterium lividum]MCC7715962.1 anhydro-N-acetylmuramic acid kinase [Janthinobacterium lividum]OEZ65028.1 anhydro-N-acetylmuramic acid kinase [Janthinobacterium lividum]WQE29777.1 anhydro-N-acetylmuramic acid kinase [Janthinobacterium lividum]STQ95265.1 Anhydro-N-acetylmuramic acid kinase [Janthinobacterium lividum]
MLYIGLMSGTSLDGVDGALVDFSDEGTRSLGDAYIPFPASLRADLMALQSAGQNEIEREALAANRLVRHYADCVAMLLSNAGIVPDAIAAIGAHGQTIRHRPELGFTRQLNNPALLAELTGIDVIADLRSRDVAAGGQGAPLVPAFHQAIFNLPGHTRVLANIGGIGNISVLHADGTVTGYDTGPGNALMDGWVLQHLGQPYDADGAWAATGQVIPALLAELLNDPYFDLPAPKSTGRDLFHADWLGAKLASYPQARPADVQATLTQLTAASLAHAIVRDGARAETVYVCGGGAQNASLMAALARELPGMAVASTAALGVAPSQVEALAFAWLAWRFNQRKPGNLPAVTGAQGLRVLGALYPR